MAFNALMRPSTMPLVDDYIGITVFSATGYMHKERDKFWLTRREAFGHQYRPTSNPTDILRQL